MIRAWLSIILGARGTAIAVISRLLRSEGMNLEEVKVEARRVRRWPDPSRAAPNKSSQNMLELLGRNAFRSICFRSYQVLVHVHAASVSRETKREEKAEHWLPHSSLNKSFSFPFCFCFAMLKRRWVWSQTVTRFLYTPYIFSNEFHTESKSSREEEILKYIEL